MPRDKLLNIFINGFSSYKDCTSLQDVIMQIVFKNIKEYGLIKKER